ncbi:MAG: BrnT family toxin [Nitrospirae bacterium]|nr:BrnT family toxin [Nitrospirota bacterium]
MTGTPKKGYENVRKHGISFNDAQDEFNDPFKITLMDNRFNYGEERWITIGFTNEELLIVVHSQDEKSNGEEMIRIISARKATKKERYDYENNRRRF